MRDGFGHIAGVDEVGRGSLAGPVVAAAVVLPLRSRRLRPALSGLRDSKQLSALQREDLFRRILDTAEGVGVGSSSHHVVDRDGIASANRRAMLRAVAALAEKPEALLLDAFPLPECSLPQLAVVKADARSLSVAAASVVAKVIRDRWMAHWDRRFPQYGFARHKGYATGAHLDALAQYGPCPLHRRSFRPLSRAQ